MVKKTDLRESSSTSSTEDEMSKQLNEKEENEIKALAELRVSHFFRDGRSAVFNQKKYTNAIKKQFPEHHKTYMKYFMAAFNRNMIVTPMRVQIVRLARRRGEDVGRSADTINIAMLKQEAMRHSPYEDDYIKSYKDGFEQRKNAQRALENGEKPPRSSRYNKLARKKTVSELAVPAAAQIVAPTTSEPTVDAQIAIPNIHTTAAVYNPLPVTSSVNARDNLNKDGSEIEQCFLVPTKLFLNLIKLQKDLDNPKQIPEKQATSENKKSKCLRASL